MGIVIFGTGKACTWCVACCDYLEREGKGYTYKNVREDEGALAELRKWGFSSVPQGCFSPYDRAKKCCRSNR